MKILCCDGGGCFGFAQAKILQDSGCAEKFDCYVGTSIGSAVVSAIAMGKVSQVGQDFFDTWMPKIFKYSFWRAYNPFLSKYPDTELNNALQSVFDGLSFGDAKKPLFVTAANISATQLKVFSSMDVSDSSIPAWKVLRYATAAETYFDPMDGYGDGGVFANNPVMVAVAAASKILGVPINEMEILDIGTGESQRSNGIPSWKLGWGKWLLEALLDGASDSMHNYFVKSLPVKKYVKIQFVRQPGWAMDKPADMKQAEKDWQKDILNALPIVRAF